MWWRLSLSSLYQIWIDELLRQVKLKGENPWSGLDTEIKDSKSWLTHVFQCLASDSERDFFVQDSARQQLLREVFVSKTDSETQSLTYSASLMYDDYLSHSKLSDPRTLNSPALRLPPISSTLIRENRNKIAETESEVGRILQRFLISWNSVHNFP